MGDVITLPAGVLTPTALRTRTVEAAFTYAGQRVGIAYRPAAIAGDMLARLQALIKRIEGLRVTVGEDAEAAEHEAQAALLDWGEAVCAILARWDYGEDEPGPDGQPVMVPLTPERVAKETERFGDFVLTAIMCAVQDFQAGKQSGAVSSEPPVATS